MSALAAVQDAMRSLREADRRHAEARAERDEALRQARGEGWTSGDLERLLRIPASTTAQAWRGRA